MSHDGSIHETNISLAILFTQPIQTGLSLNDEKLEDLCYSSTSDIFTIEENTGDIILGTINRCKDVNGITVTYKVNKRKFR